jgi:hypothetical protein
LLKNYGAHDQTWLDYQEEIGLRHKLEKKIKPLAGKRLL